MNRRYWVRAKVLPVFGCANIQCNWHYTWLWNDAYCAPIKRMNALQISISCITKLIIAKWKKKIIRLRLLLSEWWDVMWIIHRKVLPRNQTINAALYYLQLDRLHWNLATKRPGVISRHGFIHRHNNARPYIAFITYQKLLGLGWEVLLHTLLNSPDFTSTEYPLFRMLNNSFS